MTIRRWVTAVVCCGPLLWGAAEYPRPHGFVNDFAEVIDAPVEARMAERSDALRRRAGIELAVATVPTFAPESSLADYAAGLFRAWGIGDAARDRGVLLIMAVAERQVRIEVGYGLEPILTDGRAGAIIDADILPAFRRGAYGEGLANGADAIARVVEGGDGVPEGDQAPPSSPDWLTIVVVGGIILFILLTNGLARPRRRGWWDGGVWPTHGGFGGGFGGGGFGGFGGGGSGGGGAGRGW